MDIGPNKILESYRQCLLVSRRRVITTYCTTNGCYNNNVQQGWRISAIHLTRSIQEMEYRAIVKDGFVIYIKQKSFTDLIRNIQYTGTYNIHIILYKYDSHVYLIKKIGYYNIILSHRYMKRILYIKYISHPYFASTSGYKHYRRF